jgi:hypothetical protein
VCTGTSKELACANEPVFEIEIELLRTPTTLKCSTSYLAESLVLKLLDLLGRFSAHGEILIFDTVLKRVWNRPVIGEI